MSVDSETGDKGKEADISLFPSFTEKIPKEIKSIIAKEKWKLCCSDFFKNVFEKVDFNTAFANTKISKADCQNKDLKIENEYYCKICCINHCLSFYSCRGYMYCMQGNKLL